jgi:hypothetical protein
LYRNFKILWPTNIFFFFWRYTKKNRIAEKRSRRNGWRRNVPESDKFHPASRRRKKNKNWKVKILAAEQILYYRSYLKVWIGDRLRNMLITRQRLFFNCHCFTSTSFLLYYIIIYLFFFLYSYFFFLFIHIKDKKEQLNLKT